MIKKDIDRQEFLDDLAEKFWGKSQSECFKEEICVCCHRLVRFKDKEYWSSCLCQSCRPDSFKAD